MTDLKNKEHRIESEAFLQPEAESSSYALTQAESVLLSTNEDTMKWESAAGFFHEMKNILAVFKGFLQMFAMNPKYQEDLPKLDMMNREADHLYQLAMEYLGTARGGFSAWSWLDLGELMEEVQTLLKHTAGSQSVNIRMKVLAGPKIWGNAFRIRQMIFNFAKNGMEAMADGGTLCLEAGVKKGRRVLMITDEGTGFPDEVRRHFGEQVESKKENGSGVGLMFCRRVLEECRAKWRIETGDSGSRISVMFPLAEELFKNSHEIHAM